MSMLEFRERLGQRILSPQDIASRTQTVYRHVLEHSPRITQGNFERIAVDDLALLFELYDELFFQNELQALLRSAGVPLSFELSSRLTRSAGLTKRFARRAPRGTSSRTTHYVISLSTTLLFQTFRDVQRVVRVNGLECNDRLEAAMRVFEHELIHLLEMLLWGSSNCDQQRFRTLVRNYFGHPHTRHDLVTQHERARTRFDVRVGDLVAFVFEGQRYHGIVNRITRRATVLVEHPQGQRYSDRKRYVKYYIPLPMLERLAQPSAD